MPAYPAYETTEEEILLYRILSKLTLDESLAMVSLYVDSKLGRCKDLGPEFERRVGELFAGTRYSTTRYPVTDGHFELIEQLVPALDCDEQHYRRMRLALGVVESVLCHKECPPPLLAKACRGWHKRYAYAAMRNDACPVEDAVFAALRQR